MVVEGPSVLESRWTRTEDYLFYLKQTPCLILQYMSTATAFPWRDGVKNDWKKEKSTVSRLIKASTEVSGKGENLAKPLENKKEENWQKNK